ncbi:MAG: MFS transporter [Propionibacteriaceae bacterium]|jgi:MFS family permease|nr:MFS transporter [Propionibacteriaceae bacterium]
MTDATLGARVGQTRLLALILPATGALYAIYNAVQNIYLPASLEAVDPARKIERLAIITTLLSVASIVALPLGGALSDRTRSRFGRRTPWLVGSALAAAAVLLLAFRPAYGVVFLGLGCALLWFTLNLYQAAITAVLPDRVPPARRGLASSIIGLATPLGLVAGLNLAANLGPRAGHLVLAAALVVLTLAFVLGAPEGPSPVAPDLPREPVFGRRLLAVFEGFRDRDFRLAFFSGALFFLSVLLISNYTYYIFSDYIGLDDLPRHDAAHGTTVALTINVAVWVPTSVLFGYLADRYRRHKLYVVVASVGMGLSLLFPLFLPTWTGIVLYTVAGGIAFGVYMAVDLALMSLVLPDRRRQGRDLAVLAVAGSGAELLSPALGGGIIALTGGYGALFAAGAVGTIISGLIAWRIKGVR